MRFGSKFNIFSRGDKAKDVTQTSEMIPPDTLPNAVVSQADPYKNNAIDIKTVNNVIDTTMKSAHLQHHHRQQQDCPQQPSSMDSSGSSGSNNSEYHYRPLACSMTKLRRAGSTGTTGDEDYPTSDEDDFYGDDLDCATQGIASLHSAFPKSDLDRAATDLFGYQDEEADNNEPTGLFDEDDIKFSCERLSKPGTYFSEKFLTRSSALARRRKSCNSNGESENHHHNNNIERKIIDYDLKPLASECKKTLDNRLVSIDKNSSPCKMNVTETGTPLVEGDGDGVEAGEDQRNTSDNEIIGSDDCRKSTAITRNNDIDIDDDYVEEETNNGCSQRIKNADTSGSSKSLDEFLDQNSTIERLREELQLAGKELKVKDEEVTRLSRIRQDVEAELQELTASLFQEAHNMVHEANQRKASAEKLLEESRMKVEVLAAEVNALKTLVLTSTPSRPNPHLHPQIAIGSNHSDDNYGKLKHRRSPSHFNLKYGRESSPPDSPQRNNSLTNGVIADNYNGESHHQHNCHHNLHNQSASHNHNHRQNSRQEQQQPQQQPTDSDRDDQEPGVIIKRESKGGKDAQRDQQTSILEVDPRVHNEFLKWKASPCLDKSEPFVERIFREDIDLCLDFPNKELGSRVRQSVLDGIIFVEAVCDKTKSAFPKKCALLEVPKYCQYRMRLGDQENQWHSISQICRNRIISVCDFLNYLRYIERGLVKSSANDIFWEITRLRKEMILARLGLAVSA